MTKCPTDSLPNTNLTRRSFVTGVATSVATLTLPNNSFSYPSLSQSDSSKLSGQQFDLTIGNTKVNFTGKERVATTVNQGIPAPVLHWKEGETVTLNVKNNLAVNSSIH